MSRTPAPGGGPGRDEVVAILAAFGDRPPEDVPEGIDSMELAWLVHQIEQRYGASVDDEAMARMTTVSAALDVLAELRPGAGGPGPGPDAAAAGSGVPDLGGPGTEADGSGGHGPVRGAGAGGSGGGS